MISMCFKVNILKVAVIASMLASVAQVGAITDECIREGFCFNKWLPWDCTCCGGPETPGYIQWSKRQKSVCCNPDENVTECLKTCNLTIEECNERTDCRKVCRVTPVLPSYCPKPVRIENTTTSTSTTTKFTTTRTPATKATTTRTPATKATTTKTPATKSTATRKLATKATTKRSTSTTTKKPTTNTTIRHFSSSTTTRKPTSSKTSWKRTTRTTTKKPTTSSSTSKPTTIISTRKTTTRTSTKKPTTTSTARKPTTSTNTRKLLTSTTTRKSTKSIQTLKSLTRPTTTKSTTISSMIKPSISVISRNPKTATARISTINSYSNMFMGKQNATFHTRKTTPASRQPARNLTQHSSAILLTDKLPTTPSSRIQSTTNYGDHAAMKHTTSTLSIFVTETSASKPSILITNGTGTLLTEGRSDLPESQNGICRIGTLKLAADPNTSATVCDLIIVTLAIFGLGMTACCCITIWFLVVKRKFANRKKKVEPTHLIT